MIPDCRLTESIAFSGGGAPGPSGPRTAAATTEVAREISSPGTGAATTICEPGFLASSDRTAIRVTVLRNAAAAAVNADVIRTVTATAEKAQRCVITCRSARGGSRIAAPFLAVPFLPALRHRTWAKCADKI